MMNIIENVSKKLYFQKKMLVLMLLISYFIAIQTFSTSLFYMNPVFECEGVNYKVSEDEACQMIEYCHIGKYQLIQWKAKLLQIISVFTVIQKSQIEFYCKLQLALVIGWEYYWLDGLETVKEEKMDSVLAFFFSI